MGSRVRVGAGASAGTWRAGGAFFLLIGIPEQTTGLFDRWKRRAAERTDRVAFPPSAPFGKPLDDLFWGAGRRKGTFGDGGPRAKSTQSPGKGRRIEKDGPQKNSEPDSRSASASRKSLRGWPLAVVASLAAVKRDGAVWTASRGLGMGGHRAGCGFEQSPALQQY